MKVIQSFWSKPLQETSSGHIHLRAKGGWLSEELFYVSALLSCLQIKKLYGEVHLFTDSPGKQLLVDELGIPYSTVSTELDQINHLNEGLWAMGKVLCYSLQKSPFLHIDQDFFAFTHFPANIMEAELVVQNFDKDAVYYANVCRVARANTKRLPAFMQSYLDQSGNLNGVFGCNAGIIGGNDYRFFQDYAHQVYDMVNHADFDFNTPDFGLINIFLEQSTFYALALKHQKRITPLFEQMDEEFEALLRFEHLPESGFIHTVGKSKKNILTNEQVYLQLATDFPDELEQLLNRLKTTQIST